MMIGHALAAFALVATAVRLWGVDSDRALALGAVAGGFAAVPDADMVYALSGLLSADFGNAFAVTGAFWSASTVVHRSVTHSLVMAVPAAGAFGLWTAATRESGRRRAALRAGALGAVGLLAAVATAESGWLGLAVVVAFLLAGALVAGVAARRTDWSVAAITGAALVGLGSHPWGDLFTGEPPVLLYPLDARVFVDTVVLHPDPTVHLLAAFAVEVAVVWAAVLVYAWLSGFDGRLFPRPHVGVAGGYAGTAVIASPPTLEVSYHFVFPLLGLGLALSVWEFRRRAGEEVPTLPAVATGLAGVTLGLLAYGVAYLAA